MQMPMAAHPLRILMVAGVTPALNEGALVLEQIKTVTLAAIFATHIYFFALDFDLHRLASSFFRASSLILSMLSSNLSLT